VNGLRSHHAAIGELERVLNSLPRSGTTTPAWPITGPCFAWLEQHGIGGLVDIEPFHVAAYIKALKVSDADNPAVKERAAARQPCGTGGEKRDLDDTDRFHYRRRSGRARRVASLARPSGNLTGFTLPSVCRRLQGSSSPCGRQTLRRTASRIQALNKLAKNDVLMVEVQDPGCTEVVGLNWDSGKMERCVDP